MVAGMSNKIPANPTLLTRRMLCSMRLALKTTMGSADYMNAMLGHIMDGDVVDK
jgi:hypothetical protein